MTANGEPPLASPPSAKSDTRLDMERERARFPTMGGSPPATLLAKLPFPPLEASTVKDGALCRFKESRLKEDDLVSLMALKEDRRPMRWVGSIMSSTPALT